ncbi:MAG: ABC transporter permease [Limnohabitans sp.]|nr:ABC transporter permease [Limnohabitans sp.]
MLLIVITMVLPVGWLFYLSFLSDTGAFTTEHYVRMWEQPSYFRTFRTTFEVSIMTTAICLVIGYPLAYFLSELPKRAANLCMIAVLLPLWTSLLVRTYAWLVLLQRKGLINNWAIELGLWTEPIALVHNMLGTLIGTVHVMLPFLILPLYSSMRAIDRNYLRAAANLGASPMKTFWSVFFPLAMPGMATGALIVFILCLGFYITPAVLGGGKVIMVSSRIANDIEIFFNWGAASALGVVLLVMTALLIWIFMKLLKISNPVDRAVAA